MAKPETDRTAAERQRRYRERRQAKLKVRRLTFSPGLLADLLVEAGLIGAWDAEDEEAVFAALERALRDDEQSRYDVTGGRKHSW